MGICYFHCIFGPYQNYLVGNPTQCFVRIFFLRMQEFELGNSDEQNPPHVNHFDLSNFMKKSFITFFLSTIIPLNLLAQSNIVDHASSAKNQALANVMNIYNDAIGDNSMILTGSYYIESNTGVDGDPFFINNFWNLR